MFQYMWFNDKNFVAATPLPQIAIDDWIKPEDIKLISVTKWCEHCVECAVPLCYGNCENWIEREDKKCQKTFYGTYKNTAPSGTIQSAQFKFRKWGKIETILFPGFVSVEDYEKLDKTNQRNETLALGASRVIKKLFPTYKLCGAQAHSTNKSYEKKGTINHPDAFVIQCYSPSEIEYNMLIEFYTPQEVYYRNSFLIKPGYNQAVFQMDDVDYRKNARVRIFPENDIQEEIVFFLCDFIIYQNKPQKHEYAKKVKCVAWDLDNTLWDGILIESNPNCLKLRNGILDTIKALDERGIIQVVVSKNTEEEAVPVLKRLGIFDYFIYTSINWNPKSENLKKLAQLLNINVNSFAFIDDSSFERGEVGDNLPNVRIYTEKDTSRILTLPAFQVTVTTDSQNRRAMYQTEAKRKQLRDEYSGSNTDFLRSCGLVMTVRHVDESNMKRCYELVQRTNQLNLSGTKYEEEAFKALCSKRKDDCFVAFCKDKYGEYGQVGFFLTHVQDNIVVFEEYVMSCRVAAKWIEPALMQWVCRRYNAHGVWMIGKNNKKNSLLINSLKEFGFVERSQDESLLNLQITEERMIWPEIVKVKDETCKVH